MSVKELHCFCASSRNQLSVKVIRLSHFGFILLRSVIGKKKQKQKQNKKKQKKLEPLSRQLGFGKTFVHI